MTNLFRLEVVTVLVGAEMKPRPALRAADWTYVDPQSASKGAIDLRDRALVRWLFGEKLEAMVQAAGGPENVRVIFGFDS